MPEGFSVDSYKLPVQKSPMEIAQQFGAMQQQNQAIQSGAIQIDKQKLDLINERYKAMSGQLIGLLGKPDLSPADVQQVLDSQLRSGVIDPRIHQQESQELKQVPPPALKEWLKDRLVRGQSMLDTYNARYGINTDKTNNATNYQGKTDLVTGGFGPATKMPIQPPPTQEGYDTNNKRQFLGPSGPDAVLPAGAPTIPSNQSGQAFQGAVPVPAPRPKGLPVEQPAASVSERIDASYPNRKLSAGPDPLFEEGKKALTADSDLSTQKLTAIKPALLALDLVRGLRTGPGTETWNKAVAALKANGIIPIETKNDPTAIYQETNKYFNDYLSRRGGSTDAAREQLMRSSPDITSQLNPAIIKLAQTAIAQDRIEAARSKSFQNAVKDKDGNIRFEARTDYHNYPQHQRDFPAGMDERAFIVDKMTKEEKKQLFKEVSEMKPAEKARFLKSLRAFEESGVGN